MKMNKPVLISFTYIQHTSFFPVYFLRTWLLVVQKSFLSATAFVLVQNQTLVFLKIMRIQQQRYKLSSDKSTRVQTARHDVTYWTVTYWQADALDGCRASMSTRL